MSWQNRLGNQLLRPFGPSSTGRPQFFEIEHNGLPTFTDLVVYLRDRHFDLHDFACLASRRRDGRLRMGDVLFVRRGSELAADVGWG